jgi:hypothetical protein
MTNHTLDPRHAFVVEYGAEVCVWQGRNSAEDERALAMDFATVWSEALGGAAGRASHENGGVVRIRFATVWKATDTSEGEKIFSMSLRHRF